MKSGDESPHSTENGRGRQTTQAPRPLPSIKPGAQERRLNGPGTCHHFLAGDVVVAGEVAGFDAGDELALAAAAGLLPGFAASVEAGRKPRLLGLLNILAARLFTTFASLKATSSNAAFKISLR